MARQKNLAGAALQSAACLLSRPVVSFYPEHQQKRNTGLATVRLRGIWLVKTTPADVATGAEACPHHVAAASK